MKKIKLLSFMLLVAFVAFSQTNDYKKRASLGVNFLMKDFKTPAAIKATSLSNVLNDKKWTPLKEMAPGLALTYIEGLNNNIDFMAGMNLTFVDYPFKPNTATRTGQDKLLVELDANLNFKLLTDNYFVVPYISTGLGISMFDLKHFAAYFPVGAGLQFNLGSESFLNIQFRNNVGVTDLATNNFNYTLGFASPLKDKVVPPPPPPPPPAPVVEKDTDKDGIVDSKDKCPDVPGVAKYDGCPIPDTDKDGINDEEDACPKVAGIAKYKGCPIPDTDGDGVNDEQDKCPNVVGVARYGGCPIPDTDGDGVNDEVDKCPNTPGTVNNNGCPELATYNFDYKSIQFNSSSAVLTKNAVAELKKLVTILKDHAEIKKVMIDGHADNSGKADFNLKLSAQRAEAVKAYLVKNGISADRLVATGYGDTKPVADNATKEGRSENRRVEFNVTD
ncbi:MAG: OmpA family protein [Chitinophagaceae bacterium]|nr:OmpA family protein [Chitinophagaceae bacterium]MBS4043214.1 OmpA family protein [Chitinophagaceae bacterium]